MKLRILVVALVVGLATGLGAKPVYAHGFGERYDLPVPLNFFLIGAAAAVALSFVVMGLFMRRRPASFDYPRYNLLGLRWLGGLLTSRALLTAIGLAAVGVFVLVVATALGGTDRPIENLSPTMVWIIWWVGMGYVSALVGNVWMLVNPWKITFEWSEALLRRHAGSRSQGMFRYPTRLDVWPAVAIFLVFAWLESVYSDAAQPQKLGALIVLYSFVTWAGWPPSASTSGCAVERRSQCYSGSSPASLQPRWGPPTRGYAGPANRDVWARTVALTATSALRRPDGTSGS